MTQMPVWHARRALMVLLLLLLVPVVFLAPRFFFPADAASITFEAESGSLSGPFVVADGVIVQSVKADDPAQGGRASFVFDVTAPGDYMVVGAVSAPNDDADSFFINIDAEPDAGMVWDIAVSQGFAESTASWRGNGTPEAAEFAPKLWNLAAGQHQLIVRGREAQTALDRISVVPVNVAEPTAVPVPPTEVPVPPTEVPVPPTEVPVPPTEVPVPPTEVPVPLTEVPVVEPIPSSSPEPVPGGEHVEVPTQPTSTEPSQVAEAPTASVEPQSTDGGAAAVLPLTFEAEAGQIAVPLFASNGHVSQSVSTGLSNGGRAVYRFEVPTTGDYIIKAVAHAPDGYSNSVFVNIDAEPTGDAMSWDVPVEGSFQEWAVTWRKDGVLAVRERPAQVFRLAAGQHTLIIRGREKNTRLDRFAIVPASAAAPVAQEPVPTNSDPAAQSSSIAIYGDGYASGWSNWSWNTEVNASASAPVQSGSRSLAATYKSAYGGLYLHHNGVNLNGATTLQFYIHGGSAGGQRIKVAAADASTKVLGTVPLNSYISGGSVAANAWRQVNIPISALKLPSSTITGVVLQDEQGSPQPTFYIDGMQLTGSSTVSEPAPTTAPSSGTLSGPPPASGKRFTTRGVGSALPSGSECASRVRRTTWEPRTNNKDENSYIAQKGADYNLEPWGGVDSRANTNILARVDGKFTGTTDEILQWGACKWGIDEDVVRAMAVKESMWHMSMVGDNGITFGILQVKSTVWKQTSPASKKSTAFNVDYALARWRACYEGYITYMKQKYPNYGAGDMWGCLGNWYNGSWFNSGANDYIAQTKSILNQRKWESAEFPHHRY